MTEYTRPLEELVRQLHSDPHRGLDASQIDALRSQYGENRLQEKKKAGFFTRFLQQFKDVMILILLAAAAISFIVACVQQEPSEFFEPLLILVIVVLNAILGVLQESKAEKALEALKNISAPHARVVRGGTEQVIDASQLVPGDIVKLEAGDFIPADGRLIQAASLKCEESALTGESVPVEKDASASIEENAPLGDRINMVYSGCSVSYGSATAIITATGMKTEMGKIAGLLNNETEESTPLQQKLAKLGKYLGVVALIACAIIFVIGLFNDIPPLDIFMTSVSLAVSAIPEGLPAIVTIVLSLGVQRMVKKNAIIRRLPAVETLGSASVICSDKTGTLTQNRMTVMQVWVDGEDAPEKMDALSEGGVKLLQYGTLCCNGTVNIEDGKETHIGDPTETSIVLAALKNGWSREKLEELYPRVGELPFDSDRKLMTTVMRDGGKYLVVVKGAYDVMVSRCTAGNIPKADGICNQMSEQALRVLAVGYKYIDTLPETLTSEGLEQGLTLLGLVGMIDPPREEVRPAVQTCLKAGIRPVMITGDHVVTAAAIARDLGIMHEGDKAVTGAELDAMDEAALDAQVEDIAVYARVSPENKIRIVKAWQRKGQVVAMTGDGVNDAPALKAADIGCAMGITGTDVAKGAADMTLTDDNFATIVDAVREGRGIYANIRKVVGFLLGTNIGEILTVFIAMILWHESPLLSMQLLMINLVTDSLPAIALGMEAVEDGVMLQKPKPKNEGIFAHGLGIQVVAQGFMFGILTLIGYQLGFQYGGDHAGQTVAFMVLALSQVVQAYNMRSGHSLFQIGPFTNKRLNQAALVSVLLVALVMFTPLSILFEMVYLPWQLYLAGLGLALVPLVVMEIAKAIGLVRYHKH